MKENLGIIIDYYQGQDGKTIRIDIQKMEQLLRFREMISNLKDGTTEEYDLQDIKEITITGMKDLILRRESGKKIYYQKIEQISNSKETPIFLWKLTADEWWHCEGLIDGLIDAKCPGHQYLLEDNNFVIELCYMES